MDINKPTPLQKCRACLTDGTFMKNMFQHFLHEDFQKITNVELDQSEDVTVSLCTDCEKVLLICRQFRHQCQKSDIFLRNTSRAQEIEKPTDIVQCTIKNNKLTYKIIPEDMSLLEHFVCPSENCMKKFTKKNLLLNHLKDHDIGNQNLKLEVKFYCPYAGCIHNIDANRNKFFTSRKLLKQHIKKVHSERLFKCHQCDKHFPLDSDLKRHNCMLIFKCDFCCVEYKSKESYLVHLMRKHPELHSDYKESKKRESLLNIKNRKRHFDINTDCEQGGKSKKTSHTQTKADFGIFGLESPKRSLATQTLEELSLKCLKNDVSLAVTYSNSPTQTNFSPDNMKFENYLDFNSIETQTALNQTLDSNDFFNESLTDMQTQTLDPKRNYETTETQTNMFDSQYGFKETQTCPCLTDLNENDNSTYRKSDVLLSFNSIETQTSEIF